MIYKLYKTDLDKTEPNAVMTVGVEPSKSFIFDPANTDYQTFKKDIAENKPLQDADGNEMTAEAAQEFMRNLP